MKRTATWVTLFAAVLMLAVVSIAHSQNLPVTEKTFEGQLTKVDSAAKIITIKGMEDKQVKEMSFKYSDDTRIIGGDRTIQGLSGKTGASLKVTYRGDRGSNEATTIEMIEKQ